MWVSFHAQLWIIGFFTQCMYTQWAVNEHAPWQVLRVKYEKIIENIKEMLAQTFGNWFIWHRWWSRKTINQFATKQNTCQSNEIFKEPCNWSMCYLKLYVLKEQNLNPTIKELWFLQVLSSVICLSWSPLYPERCAFCYKYCN